MKEMAEKIKAIPGLTVHENLPARRITSMGVGGPVDLYVIARTFESLEALMSLLKEEKMQWMPVGAGTNLLVRDGGYRGLMVRPAERLAEIEVEEDQEKVIARCGGGAPLPRVVMLLAEKGAKGVECLAGIPGTVAGAVKGNAGGRKGSIGEFVEEVKLITRGGKKQVIKGEGIKWDYRRSNIPKGVIYEVVLKFSKEDPEAVKRAVEKEMEYRRRTQPRGVRTAGCIFLNPRKGKISAGKIIDELGLKGTRVRGARVSTVHANFIENEGNATCRDVLALVEAVREKVKSSKGVSLELEVQVVGEEA